MIRSTLLSFPLLLATVTAQRTVVVDAGSGPGTNHTTLTAALADLQADDLIILRAGTYDGSVKSTQHSFSIQGEGNPVIQPVVGAQHTMEFTFWGGQYQRANLRDLRFESESTGQWALCVGTNQNSWPAPTVHIEHCEVVSQSLLADRCGLLAQAIGLTVRSCYLNTTQIIDCVASFEDVQIVGHDASNYLGFTQRAQTALDVVRSEVWLIDSSLHAGSSLSVYAEPASCLGFADNTFTRPSLVHICGQTDLVADAAPHSQWPVPYVFQDYAPWYPLDPTVEYEAGSSFTPSPGGPVWSPGIVQTPRTITHQWVTDALLGTTFFTTVSSDVGNIVLAYASMGSHAQRIGTYELFLDMATAVPIGVAVLVPLTSASFPIAIPATPSLRGAVVEVTGAALTPAMVLEVSNPSAGLLR
jgi:hypothetical protein